MQSNAMGYRKLLGLTQKDLAEIFGISVQSIRNKEKGITSYNDQEKIIIRNLLREKVFPNITIDEIFFTGKVS